MALKYVRRRNYRDTIRSLQGGPEVIRDDANSSVSFPKSIAQ